MRSEDLLVKLKKNFSLIIVAAVAVSMMLLFMSSKKQTSSLSAEELETWSEKLENFLENMEGVGECEVLIFPAENISSANAVRGISIVCQGDSARVKTQITEAVATLFGINESQISISRKK